MRPTRGDPRRDRRPRRPTWRRHDRFRPRSLHRRADRCRHRDRRDHGPQDGRRLHRPPHRRVDTIFEIGGQDSKFISLQDGIVVDFAMNEASCRGHGFVPRGAGREARHRHQGRVRVHGLGHRHRSASASVAPRSWSAMEAHQQRGAHREDLVAGLASPIAYNHQPPGARAQDWRLHLSSRAVPPITTPWPPGRCIPDGRSSEVLN